MSGQSIAGIILLIVVPLVLDLRLVFEDADDDEREDEPIEPTFQTGTAGSAHHSPTILFIPLILSQTRPDEFSPRSAPSAKSAVDPLSSVAAGHYFVFRSSDLPYALDNGGSPIKMTL